MSLSQIAGTENWFPFVFTLSLTERQVVLSVAAGFFFHELHQILFCCLRQCARLVSFQQFVDLIAKSCVEVHSALLLPPFPVCTVDSRAGEEDFLVAVTYGVFCY